jgi:hypothetical protein
MLPSDKKLEIARRLARAAFDDAAAAALNDAGVTAVGHGNGRVSSKRNLIQMSTQEHADRIAKLSRKRMRRTLQLISGGNNKLIYTMDMERDLATAYNVEKLVEELTKIAENEKFKLSMLVRVISERLKVSQCHLLAVTVKVLIGAQLEC